MKVFKLNLSVDDKTVVEFKIKASLDETDEKPKFDKTDKTGCCKDEEPPKNPLVDFIDKIYDGVSSAWYETWG